MRVFSIVVRNALALLILVCAASIVQSQDPPKLPPDNSPPPDLSQPPFAPSLVPRVAVQRVRVAQGVNMPPKSWCPRGYQYFKSKTQGEGCVKGRNSCVLIRAITKARFGYEIDLCDANAIVGTRVDPVYPPDSIRNHEQGTVEFAVSRLEAPTLFMYIQPADPHPSRLQAAARTALDQWTWKPYMFPIEGYFPKIWNTRVYFKFEITPDGPRVRTFLREPPKNR